MDDRVGQFDVNYHPRMTIKGQAMTDFIAEFTYASTAKVAGMKNDAEAAKVVEVRDNKGSARTQKETQPWTLYVVGASNENGLEQA